MNDELSSNPNTDVVSGNWVNKYYWPVTEQIAKKTVSGPDNYFFYNECSQILAGDYIECIENQLIGYASASPIETTPCRQLFSYPMIGAIDQAFLCLQNGPTTGQLYTLSNSSWSSVTLSNSGTDYVPVWIKGGGTLASYGQNFLLILVKESNSENLSLMAYRDSGTNLIFSSPVSTCPRYLTLGGISAGANNHTVFSCFADSDVGSVKKLDVIGNTWEDVPAPDGYSYCAESHGTVTGYSDSNGKKLIAIALIKNEDLSISLGFFDNGVTSDNWTVIDKSALNYDISPNTPLLMGWGNRLLVNASVNGFATPCTFEDIDNSSALTPISLPSGTDSSTAIQRPAILSEHSFAITLRQQASNLDFLYQITTS